MTRSIEKRGRKQRHPRRQQPIASTKHWLNAGSMGQESLFLDLDAASYLIDSQVARAVASTAHAYDGNELRPFGLYVPPQDQLLWFVHHLAKYFNTYLWAPEPVEEYYELVEHFGVQSVDGELEECIDHWIDFALVTDTQWSDQFDFLQTVDTVRGMLSPEGRAYFVLIAEKEDDTLLVSWLDGSVTPLDDLIESRFPRLVTGQISGSCPLTPLELEDLEKRRAFAKRNKPFFGKAINDLLADRLSDFDVVQSVSTPIGSERFVLLLRWDSNASY